VHCRWFSGYKPCGLSESCDPQCPSRSVPQVRILFVHLGALGAVLRSTALLAPLKRKFPSSHITWVTMKPAQQLISNIPHSDQILTTSSEDLLCLQGREFDIGFCIDKSLSATGIFNLVNIDQVYGFKSEPRSGAILPATEAARELWNLGLSNHQKFFVNNKSENQLICEALELEYLKDEYQVRFTPSEEGSIGERRRIWTQKKPLVVGVNTGCSPTIPYKKLSIAGHVELINKLKLLGAEIVLLGGSEDTEAHAQISSQVDCLLSPSRLGLRDGLISTAACDVVVSGDSLGMHMAIGLKKWVVAWFGPTCSQEIELFERGIKVLTQAPCAPCWKKFCDKQSMCYDQVNFEAMVAAVRKGLDWRNSILSIKRPSGEISSSAFPL
jgi:heptosyltransferase-2